MLLQAALKKSDVGGLQMLIRTIANIDKSFLPLIKQWLQSTNVTDKLAQAHVKDLRHFLWNVYAYVDQDLSQAYCRIVDAQQRSSQLAKAELADLCLFLWNLISISDLPCSHTFNDTTIETRLATAWKTETGLAAALSSVISIAQPGIQKPLPPIQSKAQKQCLAHWLNESTSEQDPYILALALFTLRTHGEAIAMVQKLPLAKTLQLLKATRAAAITPQSKALLEEVGEWLEGLPA